MKFVRVLGFLFIFASVTIVGAAICHYLNQTYNFFFALAALGVWTCTVGTGLRTIIDAA